MKKAYILWGTCHPESWVVAVYGSKKNAYKASSDCNSEVSKHFQRVHSWLASNKNPKKSYRDAHPEDDGQISLDPRSPGTYGSRGYGTNYYVEECLRRT